MFLAEGLLTLLVFLIAVYVYKYVWFNSAYDLFESSPAVYKDPSTLPWWYMGDTCRYQRRK